MKRILITGTHGYVGTSLAAYLAQWPERYETTFVSLRDETWQGSEVEGVARQSGSWQGYDVLLHAAGLVHQAHAPAALYDRVNRVLTEQVAEKAKRDGIGKFILMSTMAVYGVDDRIGRKNEIGADSLPAPRSPYGKSKLAAEAAALEQRDARFVVNIVRAPMVYGPRCPGNYAKLRRLTLRFGLIPAVTNERSMIYIDHLCEYIRLLIDGDRERAFSRQDDEHEGAFDPQAGDHEQAFGRQDGKHEGAFDPQGGAYDGIFCPQDGEYADTASLMEWIATAHGRHVHRSRLLGFGVRSAGMFLPGLRKAFGNLTYDRSLSVIPCADYCRLRTREAVRETETDGYVPQEIDKI